MYRLFLEITTGGVTTTIDATDDLMNWSDVDLSFKRQDIDGVIRTFSTAFQFAGASCTALISAFHTSGFAADAAVRFELLDDYTWTQLFTCTLDFATLKFDAVSCEINAVDNSIAAKIKARKSTKYQYNVSDLKKFKVLNYDRLEMISKVEYFLNFPINDAGTVETFTFVPAGDTNVDFQLPLYVKKAEIATPDTSDFFDVPLAYKQYGEYSKLQPFFQSFQDRTVHVTIRFSTWMETFQPNDTECAFILALRHTAPDRAVTMTDLYTTDLINYVGPHSVYVDNDYTMQEGDELVFALRYKLTNLQQYELKFTTIEEISVSYNARSLPVTCNVISLDDMLQALVNSMTDNSGVTSEIVKQREIGGVMTDNDRLVHTYLIAADSARGLTGAQVYSSFSDFSEMMVAEFGFVPVIDEDQRKVSFMPRDLLFSDSTRHTFSSDEVRDFELSVAADLICSQVNVGYEKQDYDSVNGRDEFRFTDHYLTGLTNTDNTLDLISPYRADAYGIEFLVMKRGEDTTDNKSDEDVFLVDIEEVGTDYVLRRYVTPEMKVYVDKYVRYSDGDIRTANSGRNVLDMDVYEGEILHVSISQDATYMGNTVAIVAFFNGDTYVSCYQRGDNTVPDYNIDVTIPSGVNRMCVTVNNSAGSSYSVTAIPVFGVISPTTMFNVQFAQPYMIQANMPYLKGITNTLEVSSVEGNQDVIIDGVSVMDDVSITGSPIFLPETISVTVPAASLLTAWDAEFELTSHGYTFVTSLKDVRINVGREQSVTYTLLLKSWV